VAGAARVSTVAPAYHRVFCVQATRLLTRMLEELSQAGAVWVSQCPSTIDAAGMEPIGSHFAVLLNDAQLRCTLTPELDSRPAPASQPAVHASFNRIVKVLSTVVTGLERPRWSPAPPTRGEISAQR